MASRKRREGETFEEYRDNLKAAKVLNKLRPERPWYMFWPSAGMKTGTGHDLRPQGTYKKEKS